MGMRFIALVFLVSVVTTGCVSQSQAAINPTPITVSTTISATTTISLPSSSVVPGCSNPVSLTPAVTEGPYFKAGSPERSSLIEPGMQGTKLIISGYVTTTDCRPVANAMLDFWQANSQGQYDNNGYTLRGHLFSDTDSHYRLETIVPGLYPGRTEHIHVKVQAPDGPVLTTQLYFPGIAYNQIDPIFNPKLIMVMQSSDGRVIAFFNFVIETK